MAAKAGVLGQDVLVAKGRPPGACPPSHTAEHRHHSAHLRGDRRGAASGMAARLFSCCSPLPFSLTELHFHHACPYFKVQVSYLRTEESLLAHARAGGAAGL